MTHLAAWIQIAADRSVVKRALVTSFVVGIILTAINHAADLRHGRLGSNLVWQVGLTLLVPYLVSTISSVAAIKRQRARGRQDYLLLEREIEAIDKFPNQNPNPVLRMGWTGAFSMRTRRARPSSGPCRSRSER